MSIERLIIKNFRRFDELEIMFSSTRNIFVGENGVGKSTILQAISYVMSGSYMTIEKVGYKSLFNAGAITEFLHGSRGIKYLPKLYVEIYLDSKCEPDNFRIYGKQNSLKQDAYGMRLMIFPNDDFLAEIDRHVKRSDVFPFEYYKHEFRTFDGTTYNSYAKKHKVKVESIDPSLINTHSAIKNYVKRLYHNQTSDDKRQKINLEYRHLTDSFSNKLYTESGYLECNSEYKIELDSHSDKAFAESITAQKEGVNITDLGKGERIVLSVETSYGSHDNECELILIEEPENHLSYINMNKMIDLISSSSDKQSFISTHSNMIASRLELSKIVLLTESGCIRMNDLKEDTVKFFQKASDSKVLDFLLSKKAILVEGNAEYILVEKFYHMIHGINSHQDDITVISCNGKTFKRYLQIAELLDKKVAVIIDNDGNYKDNVLDSYSEYQSSNVCVFSEEDDELKTFEICLYMKNEEFLNKNLLTTSMNNGYLSYMLSNKAESAFRILLLLEKGNFSSEFKIPTYIDEAIKWIKN